MKIIITPNALHDLEDIGDHIARDDPRRARTFVRELQLRCQSLADYPERFPLVRRFEGQGVRKMNHGRYLVLYRITADHIDVLHIVNAAADYEQRLADA